MYPKAADVEILLERNPSCGFEKIPYMWVLGLYGPVCIELWMLQVSILLHCLTVK